MMMAVVVVMIMAVIMVIIVTRLRGLRISLHQRFDDPAQGILVEREMPGEQARKPREDERLVGEAQVALVGAGPLAVPHAPAERVGEQLVHIGEGVVR